MSESVSALTYLYLTYRPGGIDLLAKSLAWQTNKDFELVVVDDYPGRVERGLARKHVEDTGAFVRWWGPSKAKTYADTKVGCINAVNTGLVHVRSPIVCIVNDYSFLSYHATTAIHGMLIKWLAGERFLASGVAIEYDAIKPQAFDDILTWPKEQHSGMMASRPHVPELFELYFFAAQMGFFERINGMDERCDYCAPWNYECIMTQCKAHNWDVHVNRAMVLHMVDHRVWDGWVAGKLTDDSLWRINNRGAGIAKPEWLPRSPNPFDLAKLRMLSSIKESHDAGNDTRPEHREEIEALPPEQRAML